MDGLYHDGYFAALLEVASDVVEAFQMPAKPIRPCESSQLLYRWSIKYVEASYPATCARGYRTV